MQSRNNLYRKIGNFDLKKKTDLITMFFKNKAFRLLIQNNNLLDLKNCIQSIASVGATVSLPLHLFWGTTPPGTIITTTPPTVMQSPSTISYAMYKSHKNLKDLPNFDFFVNILAYEMPGNYAGGPSQGLFQIALATNDAVLDSISNGLIQDTSVNKFGFNLNFAYIMGVTTVGNVKTGVFSGVTFNMPSSNLNINV